MEGRSPSLGVRDRGDPNPYEDEEEGSAKSLRAGEGSREEEATALVGNEREERLKGREEGGEEATSHPTKQKRTESVFVRIDIVEEKRAGRESTHVVENLMAEEEDEEEVLSTLGEPRLPPRSSG